MAVASFCYISVRKNGLEKFFEAVVLEYEDLNVFIIGYIFNLTFFKKEVSKQSVGRTPVPV